MKHKFSLDYESSSRVDLAKLGAYKYASHPSTRLLVSAIARDDEEPLLWDCLDPSGVESEAAKALLVEAVRTKAEIHAFNAPFEAPMTRYRLALDMGIHELPSLEQWRCTQAVANRAALPPSLDGVASLLKCGDQKDKVGKKLIDIFCKGSSTGHVVTLHPPAGLMVYDRSDRGRKADPRKALFPQFGWDEGTLAAIIDGTAEHHEEPLWDWLVKVDEQVIPVRRAWEIFCDYCKQDVRTEREVARRLKNFTLRGRELESFQFTLRMNDRGIPINIPAAKHARHLINSYQKGVKIKFRGITGMNPTQIQKLLPWFQQRGYPGENLQADTVAEALEDRDLLDPDCGEALHLYSLLSFAALKKIPTMIDAACPDGRVRGTMLWHGARTGRATGRIVQPQNMKRPTLDTTTAYEMIQEEAPLEDFVELYPSPLDAIASCARHFIQSPGEQFLDADYVGVEARIAPWLAGDEEMLASIVAGEDQHRKMATKIYNCTPEEVTKDQRQVAKGAVFACIFGAAGKALRNGLRKAPYYVDLPLKECRRIVQVYRGSHPKIVEAWEATEEAMFDAVINNKSSEIFNGRIKVSMKRAAGLRYLAFQLPSGRHLFYPSPRVKKVWHDFDEEDMKEDPTKAARKGYWRDEVQYWGKKPLSAIWGWVSMYSSKTWENFIQAIGADLLHEGCVNAERDGFKIFLVVHDQALAPKRNWSVADFCAALCKVSSWADSFPLVADGGVVNYYQKDL